MADEILPISQARQRFVAPAEFRCTATRRVADGSLVGCVRLRAPGSVYCRQHAKIAARTNGMLPPVDASGGAADVGLPEPHSEAVPVFAVLIEGVDHGRYASVEAATTHVLTERFVREAAPEERPPTAPGVVREWVSATYAITVQVMRVR